MSDDDKALVKRLFNEVCSAENLAGADEIMAEDLAGSTALHTRAGRSSGCGLSSRIWR